jgi:hypothetical protein
VSLKDQQKTVGARQRALDAQQQAVEEWEAVVDRRGPVSDGIHGTVGQPRLLVGITLIAAGLIWAVLRGLEFYGLSPIHLAYDLDQPPLLLLLVGAWLLYRSRLK